MAIFLALGLTWLSFLVGKVSGAYTTVPQPVFLLLSDKRGSRLYEVGGEFFGKVFIAFLPYRENITKNRKKNYFFSVGEIN